MPPGLPWAASAYDTSTLPRDEQRTGIYLRDTIHNRRDPSGARTPIHFQQAVPHHLLDDHDLVYTTAQSPPQTATLPDLPKTPVAGSVGGVELLHLSPRRASSPPTAQLFQSGRFEFQRRGQRAGDVGWGCARPNPRETLQNGRIDGHALVSSDLHKKHQFMRLSGDPSFDKRAGKLVLTAGSLRRPDNVGPRKR
jgi:hypothetical protein